MPVPILMPALSPTMEKGTLVKWKKKEGDAVHPGDVIAEIETDKAVMEVESVDDGVLGKILIKEGVQDVLVNTPIAILLLEGENESSLKNYAVTTDVPQGPLKNKIKHEENIIQEEPSNMIREEKQENTDRFFSTPLARRLAREKNIDISKVKGSGPHGRVVKSDIDSYSPSFSHQDISQCIQYNKVYLSNMRKVIAQRMTESKSTIPHFYLTIQINVKNLIESRQRINDTMQDVKITINDMIVKALAKALMNVPQINATYHGDFVHRYTTADIAIAISLEEGLVTPIVRLADRKSLKDISLEIKMLAQLAKDGKLKPEDYQGGSFTISNLGMFGIVNFQAIINPPQVAILAVGAAQEGIMSLTLSLDHRAVDGSDGARFLKTIKEYLEDPILLLV